MRVIESALKLGAGLDRVSRCALTRPVDDDLIPLPTVRMRGVRCDRELNSKALLRGHHYRGLLNFRGCHPSVIRRHPRARFGQDRLRAAPRRYANSRVVAGSEARNPPVDTPGVRLQSLPRCSNETSNPETVKINHLQGRYRIGLSRSEAASPSSER